MLPEEYQEVEYIQNSGPVYIQTNFSGNIYVEGVAQCTDISGEVSRILFGQSAGGARWFGTTNGVIKSGSNSFSVNPLNKFRFSMSWNFNGLVCSNVQTVNGETITRDAFTSSQPVENLSLLAAKTNGVWGNYAVAKIWSIHIYSDTNKTNVIGNLVPCYRKSDNRVGFYDKVNDVFYTYSGSGTMTKGPNITYGNIL